MNISKEHKRINTILDKYRSRIDSIPDELFDVTPPNGGWSYAEVYSHIMQASLASGIAIDRCTSGTAKPVTGGINFLGRMILLTGSFPPVTIKVPTSVASKILPVKISKEEARNLIIKCRKRMDDIAEVLKDASAQRRSKHPRMGMLNAKQWYKFIRIHLKHHIKQLDRITKALGAK